MLKYVFVGLLTVVLTGCAATGQQEVAYVISQPPPRLVYSPSLDPWSSANRHWNTPHRHHYDLPPRHHFHNQRTKPHQIIEEDQRRTLPKPVKPRDNKSDNKDRDK